MNASLRSGLETSLTRQKWLLSGSVVLTPVDSFSIYNASNIPLDHVEGLYATDRPRSPDETMASKIFFAGRGRVSSDMQRIYSAWATALGAAETSMRLLSGLHAHTTVFMGLGRIGDTVMLLPERGGGHFATSGILQRLGYSVSYIPIDVAGHCIDKRRFIDEVRRTKPAIVFIDRSEGLVYEDFSGLFDDLDVYAVFDASQYLPGILARMYKSPFAMGFDLVVSSLHKSFPGPQKALVATRISDERWHRVKGAMSQYVSSVHVRSTYLAGFALAEGERLTTYATRLIDNAVELENALVLSGVHVERRKPGPPTQHVWVPLSSAEHAFAAFRELERCRIHTNYRLLPYDLGYGLRLGTTAATIRGLRPSHVRLLAKIIGDVIGKGFSLHRRHAIRELARSMESTNDLGDSLEQSGNADFPYDTDDSVLLEWEHGKWSSIPPPPAVHSPEYRRFMVDLLRQLRSGATTSLISLGCGNGFLEADLSAAGFEVLATDRSSHALACASAKELRTRRVDALAPPDNLGMFDIVYADGLVGHLFLQPDGPAAFAAVLAKITKREGYIVLSNDLSGSATPTLAVTGRPDASFYRGTPGDVSRKLLGFLPDFKLAKSEVFDFVRPGRGKRIREVVVLRRQ